MRPSRAAKNFYGMMQIARNLTQIWEKGVLDEELRRRAGSSKNVATFWLEAVRRQSPDLEELESYRQRRIRVSLGEDPSYRNSS